MSDSDMYPKDSVCRESMVRFVLCVSAMLFLTSLGLAFDGIQAQAFFHISNAERCVEGTGETRISGCTEIIKSKRAFGQPISEKNLAKAYFNRGLAYRGAGRYKRAIADFTNAIKLDPKHKKAYDYRGRSYEKIGESQKAQRDFDKISKPEPNVNSEAKAAQDPSKKARAYNKRGLAFDDNGKYTLAIAEFTKAIRLKPDYALAYNNRGLSYENKGTFDRAIADYLTALKLDPSLEVARKNLRSLGVSPPTLPK